MQKLTTNSEGLMAEVLADRVDQEEKTAQEAGIELIGEAKMVVEFELHM